ncbi:MAG TPA: hypothetical protein PL128_04365, partial [Ginsengibacter sp.]|nr:hypothetical protein [Ginsengibacter sp.]
RFGGVQCNVFFRAPYSGKVSLWAGAESNTPLRIFTTDSVLIDEQVGAVNFDTTEQLAGRTWRLKSFSFEAKEGVTYFIRTRFGFSRVVMRSPRIVLFKHPGQEDFDNYQYPEQYFYVPLSAEEIVFYDSQPEGTNRRGYLIAPDGTKLLRQPAGFRNVYRVPVQPQFRGKVWTADFGHPTWKFLNIPNVSSLQRFTYKE